MKINYAAIFRSDGVIITGKNHAECIKKSPFGTCKKGSKAGFVTDDGTFVNREYAARIAYSSGQIPRLVEVLFSEDLTCWDRTRDINGKLK